MLAEDRTRIRKLFTIVCCLAILSSCRSSGSEVQENKQRGDTIIQAITAYEQDHDQLPGQLDDLVPIYLADIPKTVSDDDFLYGVNGIDGFLLSFDLQSRDRSYCSYIYRFQSWDCGVYANE
ncbi:hypothetical protein [Candidatus Leptofilum sp.]|uniref:hypothetical protein n=1 Tax=Candidatus Leptofilum sp. TaxID=3241576 RepID=UPI003B58C329